MHKEIEAFDILWANIIEIDCVLSKLFFFDKILLESEYNYTQSYLLIDENDTEMRAILEKTTNIEYYKPYLSDKLYELFYLYRAIFFRILLKYIEGRNKGNIEKWVYDESNIERLKKYINPLLIEKFSQLRFGGLKQLSLFIQDMIIKNKPQISPIPTIQVETNYGNITGINNGLQLSVEIKQIDEIIEILKNGNIPNKEEIIKVAEEYKLSPSMELFGKFVGMCGNTGTVGQILATLIQSLS